MKLEETAQPPIGVLIVEDEAVTRKVLSLEIAAAPQLQLLAALDSVKAAQAWLETGSADVLVVDLMLTDGSGLDVIHACASHHPQTDILVLTTSRDANSVLACIEAGAAGYVLKDTGIAGIAAAILELRQGGAPISPAIARMVLAKIRGDKARLAAPAAELRERSVLTSRETVILGLIAQGGSYGEVAKLLSVSVGTVQTHIKNIYGKLSVHSRGEAVYEAHRRGLLQFDQAPARK